jgi:hypothetical protein
MIIARGLMRLFHLEDMIERQAYSHVRRRIDQIFSGLEQLSEAPAELWSTIELIPLESESINSSSAAEDSRLQLILARVAETLRSISPDWRTQVEKRHDPQIEKAA